jgi:tetratricopeptide (TPR) repeat protein
MPVLDAEELLHLALHATKNNDPQAAIEHLKGCLEQQPANAKALYLLGALYAQIGMYPRAKEFLQQAVSLDPHEYTAVFQLGLLHLTSGEIEAARTAWRALDTLEADHYFQLFKSGMLALVEDRFDDCVDLIERGIRANLVNEALNSDMLRIKVSAEVALRGSENAESPDEQSMRAANHLVLSGYQQAQPK